MNLGEKGNQTYFSANDGKQPVRHKLQLRQEVQRKEGNSRRSDVADAVPKDVEGGPKTARAVNWQP